MLHLESDGTWDDITMVNLHTNAQTVELFEQMKPEYEEELPYQTARV